jgi:hypothetical protein
MDAHETPLEMAQRHVTEGEARVSRQKDLIARFEARGLDTAGALDVLASMQDALSLMYQSLAHQWERATRTPPERF